jgi:hypothetical protein
MRLPRRKRDIFVRDIPFCPRQIPCNGRSEQKKREEFASPNQLHTWPVKKSVAMSTSMRVRTNPCQVMVFWRSGAGGMHSMYEGRSELAGRQRGAAAGVENSRQLSASHHDACRGWRSDSHPERPGSLRTATARHGITFAYPTAFACLLRTVQASAARTTAIPAWDRGHGSCEWKGGSYVEVSPV